MLPKPLLERLADGRGHSHAELRRLLNLDADELAAQIEQLRSTGLEIVDAPGGSIRLGQPIVWIDAASIESKLSDAHRQRVESLTHAFEIESTNRLLLDGLPPAPAMARVATAEYQASGRGRLGRRWTMPPGTGVALSVSWRFGPAHGGLEALSLAAGAVARRALRDLTRLEIGLKWPNDLLVDGAKLGGILVELTPLTDGGCHAVVGIGINVDLPPRILARASDLPQGACDLATAAPDWPRDRAALAARLTGQLIDLFTDYPAAGFAPYRSEWLAAHVLDGQCVELSTHSGRQLGRVVDVAADGALIVEHEGGARQRLISGDVTIRASR